MAEDKDKTTENTETTEPEDLKSSESSSEETDNATEASQQSADAQDSSSNAPDDAPATNGGDAEAQSDAGEVSEDSSAAAGGAEKTANPDGSASDKADDSTDDIVGKSAEDAMAELSEIESDSEAADLGKSIGALREPEAGQQVSDDPDAPVAQPVEFPELSAGGEQKPGRNIDLLMDVKLPISIELGRTSMTISDILALGSGSVVELDKLAGEPVDLLVNNKIVAHGEVVVVDENFGIRITGLVTPEERLNSLK